MQKLLPPLTHIYGALLVDWNSTTTAVPVLYVHKPSLSSQRSCSHRCLAQGVGCVRAGHIGHLAEAHLALSRQRWLRTYPQRAARPGHLQGEERGLSASPFGMHLLGGTHCSLLSGVTGQKKAIRSQSIVFLHPPQISQISPLPAENLQKLSARWLCHLLTYSY